VLRSLLRQARKLRGRDVRELRVRGSQALAAWRERSGLDGAARAPLARQLAPGVPADPERLLAHFRARSAPRFFGAFDAPDETLTALRHRCPADEADVVARAGRVLGGHFDLLGHRDLSYGDPMDWHLDPVAGKRAPLAHWSRVPYLDPAVVGDHKVTWEVNRHQYFVVLGQAYWYTRDERYARGFLQHVESWLDANPPKLGINWASSLEVAYRAISWMWALHFFRASPALTPALLERILASLTVHARHLETYLSTYFSPNTHLTGEAIGLYYLGTLLPELREAGRWRDVGRAILLEQMRKQVHPDGVYFEQASQYQRYTADIYLHFLLLAEANGDRGAAELRATVQRLLDHLLHLARPDGTIPLIGDDDGGRLVQLDARGPHDVRALLAAGAAIFGRVDYAYAAGDDLAGMLWLLGAGGLRRLDALDAAPPLDGSRAFPDGGYFVMRDGWGEGANQLVIDCGPHGTMNCGHAHADALAVQVVARGRPAFVDAGTYTYPGPERDAFRHTRAHNAVTIDGESSSVPEGPFAWGHIARAEPRAWTSRDVADFFEGAHDGYARLPDPVAYSRAVLFVKGGYWVVRDRATAAGRHELAARWHCAPELRARPLAPGVVQVGTADEPLLHVAAFGQGGTLGIEDAWVSPAYGAREAAHACVYVQSGVGEQEVITFLMPVAGTGALPTVREVQALGGRAFVVEREGGDELLLLGRGTRVEAEGAETDAEWAWVRWGRENEPVEGFVVRGSYLRAGGRELVAAGTRADWLAMERRGSAPPSPAGAHSGR
jgi:uncharacterized heparinase superfamily protein